MSLTLLALLTGAQAPASAASACRVVDRTEAVVVMVCTAGSDADTIRAAAAAACGERAACNVWVWDSAAKAPKRAPVADAQLDKSQAGSAIAIWANDSQSLMRLRTVQPQAKSN